MTRILFVFNDDQSIFSHRLHLIRFAIDQGFTVGVVAKLGRFKDVLLKLDIKLYDWSINRGSQNPLAEFVAIRDLRRFFRDFEPELIHAVAIKPIFYSSVLCRLGFSEAMLVTNFGGLGFIFRSVSFRSKVIRSTIRPLLSFALKHKKIAITVQNTDDREFVAQLAGRNQKDIHLLNGSGVDLPVLKKDKSSSAPTMVIFIGRLLHEKGIKEFVQAAKKLKKIRPEVRFVVVGDRDEHNPASVDSCFISHHMAEKVVEFWGHQDSVNDTYMAASIVCLPSYHEGLPRVLIEASAFGKPIVTFNVPGCRDVVRIARNGILVEKGDQLGLQQALLELIDEPDKARHLGNMGRKAAELYFSSDVVNQKTWEIWVSNLLKPKA